MNPYAERASDAQIAEELAWEDAIAWRAIAQANDARGNPLASGRKSRHVRFSDEVTTYEVPETCKADLNLFEKLLRQSEKENATKEQEEVCDSTQGHNDMEISLKLTEMRKNHEQKQGGAVASSSTDNTNAPKMLGAIPWHLKGDDTLFSLRMLNSDPVRCKRYSTTICTRKISRPIVAGGGDEVIVAGGGDEAVAPLRPGRGEATVTPICKPMECDRLDGGWGGVGGRQLRRREKQGHRNLWVPWDNLGVCDLLDGPGDASESESEDQAEGSDEIVDPDWPLDPENVVERNYARC